MTEIELLQGRLEASRDAWGRAIKGQETAEAALKAVAAKRAPLEERRDAVGVRAKTLRSQIVAEMFESEEVPAKQLTSLLNAEFEHRLLDEALAGISRQAISAARQVVLNAKVGVAEAALSAHEAHLALHTEQVKDQLRWLQSTVGSFEVMGLGSVADSLAREVLNFEKAVHKARWDAKVHADENADLLKETA